jgi:SAM-dependent methyltransferase
MGEDGLHLGAIKSVMQSAAGHFGLELRSPVRRRPSPKGPRLTEEGIGEEYFKPYPLSRYYPLWTVIADRIWRDRLRRVLEVGCGNGRLAALLLEHGVEQYVGFDFSPVFIRMARGVAPRARFVVEDARTSSIYTDFEHDVIVCTEVLEHIPDDLFVISRFPAGSRCLCTVPNFGADGHVRHFGNSREVAARYSPFFTGFDVVAFKGATGSGVGTYFVFDGVRNDRKSSEIGNREL